MRWFIIELGFSAMNEKKIGILRLSLGGKLRPYAGFLDSCVGWLVTRHWEAFGVRKRRAEVVIPQPGFPSLHLFPRLKTYST